MMDWTDRHYRFLARMMTVHTKVQTRAVYASADVILADVLHNMCACFKRACLHPRTQQYIRAFLVHFYV